MYPHPELSELASRKVRLQQQIAAKRVVCAIAAKRAVKPLALLDRFIAVVRRAAPLLPILSASWGLFAARNSAMKTSLARSVLRWGPMLIEATRYVSSAFSRNHSVRRADKSKLNPTPISSL